MFNRRFLLATPALLAACAMPPVADPSGQADAEMRLLLESLARLNPRPIETLDAAAARRQPGLADAVRARLRETGRQAEPRRMARVDDLQLPTPMGAPLAARLYVPENAGPGSPLVVYFHGGGWVIAGLDTYDASARAIAAESAAMVLSVHYRQGPEHRFPAAHEDAISAWRWATAQSAALGFDPRRAALAGESAGGNLAIATAIAARDQGLPRPAALALVYPVAGTDTETDSYRRYADAKPLNRAAILWFVRNYTRFPRDQADPRLDVSRGANLAGLPRTIIVNAQIDPLLDDGMRLEAALRGAGVPVRRVVYPGVTHEFFGADAVLGQARLAQRELGEELRAAFAAVPVAQAPAAMRGVSRAAAGARR